MTESGFPHRGLVLLGRAFRDRASGVLSLGRGSTALGLVLREGHIVGVVFPEDAPSPASTGPDDSAQGRLDRVLAEIGIRPAASRPLPRTRRSLRERMLTGLLASGRAGASFADGAPAPAAAVEVAGATESLILEAIRRVPDPQAVRDGLGDIDQRLVPSASIAEERTLTLTEGYILSHVDGTSTARHVLQSVTLEPRETERTLLGLLLTGRLEYRPAAAAKAVATAAALDAPTEPAAVTAPAAEAAHEPILLKWDDAEPVARSAAASAPLPLAIVEKAEATGTEAPGGPAAADHVDEAATAAPAEEPVPAPVAAASEERTDEAAVTEDAPAADAPDTAAAEAAPASGDAIPGTTELPGPVAAEAAATPSARDASKSAGPSADAPAATEAVAAAPTEAAAEATGDVPADAEAPPVAAPDSGPEPRVAVLDPALVERRREILAFFESLSKKNHFEVLGVEPGCADAEVKRAYASLARKYHPDMHHRGGLDDLHDVLEGIFIRVGEAWEVLGDARSRRSYETRLSPAGRGTAPAPAPPGWAEGDVEPYVPGDETVQAAQLLLSQARYWDVIQMLESRLPQMPPSKQQRRGRILLARAYAKNPNWLRRAEEALQQVVREDPANADAHYELGLLYKAGGMMARAQGSFRRVLELRPDHREAATELAGPKPTTPASAPSGGLLKRLFGGRGKAS